MAVATKTGKTRKARKAKQEKPKVDHYKRTAETVTAKLIELIEQADPNNFTAPWVTGGLSVANNPITGLDMTGGNWLICAVEQWRRGFLGEEISGYWATVNQWRTVGRFPTKGCQMIWLLRPQVVKRKDKETGKPILDDNGNPSTFVVYKTYPVIPWEDTKGDADSWHPPIPKARELNGEPVAVPELKKYFEREGIKFTEQGDRAYYERTTDRVNIPAVERWGSAPKRDSVAAHEATHSTGPRLKRDMAGTFGSEKYAAEELVAELGAAMICAHLGIPFEERGEGHADYLANWLQLFKDDSSAILKASTQAQKALRFIFNTTDGKED